MSVWERLEAQANARLQLQRAIEHSRVPHAYLFTGPVGAPFPDAVVALACGLNCMAAPGEACGDCEACAKILQGIHPDIITLGREGAAQIVPIETVRTQVIGRISLLPHEAAIRLIVVEEATAMAPPAANALLKTLEEPPARTVFILCTTAPEQLLPTLRSRCQRVRFRAGFGSGSDAAIAAGASDAQRAERIGSLGAELASAAPDLTLPARATEGKGDVGPILVAAAAAFHARAREAAGEHDLEAAARASRGGQIALSWHTAVTIHNANAQLAVEAVMAQLAAYDRTP